MSEEIGNGKSKSKARRSRQIIERGPDRYLLGSGVNPARLVIITYRGSTDAKSKFDGEPVAVEFLK